MNDYRGADFTSQDLAGMDFTDCDLTHANFSGAKLAGATFTNAKLTGAKFTYADFVNADLSDSQLREIRIRILGQNMRIFRDGRIQIGRHRIRSADEWNETGAQDFADFAPKPNNPEDFIAERDAVFAASTALRGLYSGD